MHSQVTMTDVKNQRSSRSLYSASERTRIEINLDTLDLNMLQCFSEPRIHIPGYVWSHPIYLHWKTTYLHWKTIYLHEKTV